MIATQIRPVYNFDWWNVFYILLQARSQRGDMGECPPSWIEKKILAPELQTDDCFATGVTRQTLLNPKEKVQFQR